MGLTVVEFHQIRHCHWCVHHRRLQPASRGCSLLSFARSAILAELYLPPCCSCTPISVRHPQLPSPLRLAPDPCGGHGRFPLEGGGRSACIPLLVLHAAAPLWLHSLVLYSRELADTESRSYLARNTDDRITRDIR